MRKKPDKMWLFVAQKQSENLMVSHFHSNNLDDVSINELESANEHDVASTSLIVAAIIYREAFLQGADR